MSSSVDGEDAAQELAVDKGHDDLTTTGISPGSLKLPALDLEHFRSAFRHLRKIAFSLSSAKTDGEWDILVQGNLDFWASLCLPFRS